ncbi:hypothetical protein [Pseudobacillus badius]|uniref:hypothetical protein n=1 Tax=Bacillus badius TaxID=1455 RepID=UPI0007B045CC|nr:hypothetical protein [Bacillus badius]KZO00483.1 hypothetical protein A4244_15690 [Bacillus badius]OCS87005.1 hypothetical protein A6M11_15705 [Bacillus badius]OVE45885.1 hypothetical protein B1A98_19895 [Bacillus badius]TDV97112.1 hypothetical protein B0G66_1463 [Bacillus badius]
MQTHWKIIDFSKQVGKHYNTIDAWFKKLEAQQIHYVNRLVSTQEKAYDELDLKIALFIKEKRKEKWSLDAIFESLPQHFELRPFPLHKERDNDSQVISVESLREQIAKEITVLFEKKYDSQVALLKKELLAALPSPEQERDKRITDMITQHRIRSQLEDEALGKWKQQPEEERIKRVGFFRKEEDRDKREQFIKKYVQENFERKIKEDFEDD